MPLRSIPRYMTRRVLLVASAVLLQIALATAFAAAFAAISDEQTSDSVGTIDGAAIAVNGPMRVEVSGGFVKTILRSGSDVRVQSGVARLELVEGGSISICGPAHFSVLKSGGALTIALETGTIHAHIEREPALIIYTAQIQARPMAIGDAQQDVEAGLGAPGELCIRANRGAVRLEQQFTGQNVIIPQGGDILLANGQLDDLRAGSGRCTCEPEIAKAAPVTQPEMSQSASREVPRNNAPDAIVDPPVAPAEKPPSKEGPIYQVFMPPLIYDPKAKVQPEVDPSLMVLVRRVRVRPTLIFQGRVEGDVAATVTQPHTPAPTSAAATPPQTPAPPANDSFTNRVRNFVRKLWSRGS